MPVALEHPSLLSVSDMTRADIERILDRAGRLDELCDDGQRITVLSGRLVLSLFLEASTRTSVSFELAARRLGADVVSMRGSGSSLEKGESLKDTILTLCAYKPDAIVLRHSENGAAALAARISGLPVINAGDGIHQHPTQALLDLYTIKQALGQIEGVRVAVVGDILHSRVARSLTQALTICEASVIMVAPPTLLPAEIGEAFGCEVSTDIAAIKDCDIVYTLRMQNERFAAGSNFVPSLGEYHDRWGVTERRLRPGQLVMHPGPLNRGVEISDEVADSSRSLILRQVANGLPVRMSCFCDVLGAAGV